MPATTSVVGVGHLIRTAVTVATALALTPLGRLQALVANIGLTLAYALYGYFFHLGFDRLRPVGTSATKAR